MRYALGLLLAIASAPLQAALPAPTQAWIQANEHELLDELEAFVRLPNASNDPAALRRNAEHLLEMMERRHLEPRLLEGTDGQAPTLYGTWRVPGATRTLVLYAHYDGVPVDAAKWASGPWVPTWRSARLETAPDPVQRDKSHPMDPDWRLYARSASDDKAGIVALLAATDVLRANGWSPYANLVFLFDGEEESGSPHLRQLLERHRDLLVADAWLIGDGTRHASGRPQLVFGVRGIATVDLTVYGANRTVHSGQYGNFAPNAALRLAQLLASMKDDDGRVRIRGWYDDVAPLGDAENSALQRIPSEDGALLRDLGLVATELDGVSLAQAVTLPTLNINGLRAADVGAQARNVIPAEAQATLDLRLVQGNGVERQFDRLRDHVRAAAYHVLDRAPTKEERAVHPRLASLVLRPGAYPAARTRMDLPVARETIAALRDVHGDELLLTPSLGGSLPLSVITDVLGAPVLVVPISNADNNQHGDNENLRLGALWDGIAGWVAVMHMGAAPRAGEKPSGLTKRNNSPSPGRSVGEGLEEVGLLDLDLESPTLPLRSWTPRRREALETGSGNDQGD